jgi:hypothetical protein
MDAATVFSPLKVNCFFGAVPAAAVELRIDLQEVSENIRIPLGPSRDVRQFCRTALEELSRVAEGDPEDCHSVYDTPVHRGFGLISSSARRKARVSRSYPPVRHAGIQAKLLVRHRRPAIAIVSLDASNSDRVVTSPDYSPHQIKAAFARV